MTRQCLHNRRIGDIETLRKKTRLDRVKQIQNSEVSTGNLLLAMRGVTEVNLS